MKRILTALLFIFLLGNMAAAQGNNISFVYINGSNTNDEKMTKWFLDGVAKTQKDMVKAFNSSPIIQKNLLKNGTRKINEEAVPFYWGDMSQVEIEHLREDLDITKLFSPHIAQSVRALIAYCLHDAIWVTKSYNMAPIVRNLHKTVMEEYNKGNSVILFGYSAGSFITIQYLLLKAPYVSPKDLFSATTLAEEEKKYVQATPAQDTCIDALVSAQLIVLSNENQLIPNNNPEVFRKNYASLDDYTKKECIPNGTVDGIVNFASPFALFYSSVFSDKYQEDIFNTYMMKYWVKNNKFFITVNYAEDPLGIPTTENLTFEQLRNYWGTDDITGNGFIYDKSDAKTSRTFISAHTSYWATSKKFSKTVVQAYEEGLEHFYKNDMSPKIISQFVSDNINKSNNTAKTTISDFAFGDSTVE